MDQSTPPTEAQTLSYSTMVQERQRRLAIAALVFGILGLFCPPVGLIGVALGIAVLISASKTPHIDRGRGYAIAGLCVGAVSVVFSALLIAILLPSLARAREMAKRTVCAANRNAAFLAISVYADDHDGTFPPDLNTLINNGSITPQHLTCPSSELPPDQPHYFYVKGLTADCGAQRICVYENPGNHGGKGGNLTYCDGSTRFQSADTWQGLLRAGGVPGS